MRRSSRAWRGLRRRAVRKVSMALLEADGGPAQALLLDLGPGSDDKEATIREM